MICSVAVQDAQNSGPRRGLNLYHHPDTSHCSFARSGQFRAGTNSIAEATLTTPMICMHIMSDGVLYTYEYVRTSFVLAVHARATDKD